MLIWKVHVFSDSILRMGPESLVDAGDTWRALTGRFADSWVSELVRHFFGVEEE